MMTRATELSLILQYAERADRQITDNLVSFLAGVHEEVRNEYEQAPDADARAIIQGRGRAIKELKDTFIEARRILKASREQAVKDKPGDTGAPGRPVF